jgi:hypothetical protein
MGKDALRELLVRHGDKPEMMLPAQKLDPFTLPPGTQVGPWTVKAYRGGGAYGMVFQAVRTGEEQAGVVALKVACYPGDPRFQREVELLKRVHHPSVPPLLGQGEWQHASGRVHPFLAMPWVEGLPLYEWARRLNPSCREVLRVHAQVAGAVAATHAKAGVHRDVKGDNLLVNPKGPRATLLDFGAGTYAGAAPITREALPPGTDDYRSPEAWEYALQRPREATTSYAAQPEDDVFSLGVCGYRLVTGWYLPPVEVRPEEPGPWRLEWTAPQPPVEVNPRVEPQLSTLLMRMVSKRPEERPTAHEVAEALGVLARSAGAEADRPLFQGKEERAPVAISAPERAPGRDKEESRDSAKRVSARARVRTWAAYAACAMLGGVTTGAAVAWWLRPRQEARGAEVAQSIGGEQQRENEPVGLGDTGLTAPAANVKASVGARRLSLPIPRTPLKGQRRAPHCLPAVEVTINGGCWAVARASKPPCGDNYEWQGLCYVPTFPVPRQPTSDPPE